LDLHWMMEDGRKKLTKNIFNFIFRKEARHLLPTQLATVI